MNEPPAEVRQASLFHSPIARLYELQDALDEDIKVVKEMEKAYPEDMLALIEQKKEIDRQIKAMKDVFLHELRFENDEYREAYTTANATENELNKVKAEIKELAAKETRENGDIDQTFEINGSIVRFQTQKSDVYEFFLDGKAI